ncbi:hypothetical protein [Sphingomonas hankookensis]|uniref:hypothetical protein n=1 Tax=Sphingomonas hankookensis TaxID=563996 RepID=UPI003F7A13EB
MPRKTWTPVSVVPCHRPVGAVTTGSPAAARAGRTSASAAAPAITSRRAIDRVMDPLLIGPDPFVEALCRTNEAIRLHHFP